MWTRRYPLTTSRADIQIDIDDAVAEFRKRHPKGHPGTLAADTVRYLQILVNRPALQKARDKELAWWCARFGHRARWSLQAAELKTALNELLASGKAASTVRHHRTALFHLYTELDGRNAPNPLRDVPPPRQPDPLPRAIPYEVIDAIFAAMPDRRHGRKLTSEQARAVHAQAAAPAANHSAIARAFGISEAMVRKITRRGVEDERDTLGQTKARLQVMAYTGLPPAQLRAVQADDVDWQGSTVLVRGRKKGGGVRPVRLPLTPRGLEAFQAFAAAKAWGTFSISSARQVLKRAIRAMCEQLEAKADTQALGAQLRQQLAGARPYDFRHSFLTESLRVTRNVRVTQALAMHSDARMTERYTLAAVDPMLAEAAALLAAAPVGRPSNIRPTLRVPEPAKSGQNIGISETADQAGQRAVKRRKP